MRRNAKKTQKQAAEYLGVSRETICNWEGGVGEPGLGQGLSLMLFYNINLEPIKSQIEKLK